MNNDVNFLTELPSQDKINATTGVASERCGAGRRYGTRRLSVVFLAPGFCFGRFKKLFFFSLSNWMHSHSPCYDQSKDLPLLSTAETSRPTGATGPKKDRWWRFAKHRKSGAEGGARSSDQASTAAARDR